VLHVVTYPTIKLRDSLGSEWKFLREKNPVVDNGNAVSTARGVKFLREWHEIRE